MGPHRETVPEVETVPKVEGLDDKSVSIVVLGASGDLSVKKTFPALFELFCRGLLPKEFQIVGFARSKMDDKAFQEKISQKFERGKDKEKKMFLEKHVWYHQGMYEDASFKAYVENKKRKIWKSRLNHKLDATEVLWDKDKRKDRIFYMALPPTVFMTAASCVQKNAMASDGKTRIVVEKPFGHDLQTSDELSDGMAQLFKESQLFRIDHYLGKEIIQNMMVARFANPSIVENSWHRRHISSVLITFKEPFGTDGRAAYFDQFGIIRDVMQNHLLQIYSLVAMEPPASAEAECIRDAKVEVLKRTSPAALSDTVVGQYVGWEKHPKPGRTIIQRGYLDEEGVPKDSTTPTLCQTILYCNNERWRGVPFILRGAKAVNERKSEVRLQFREPESILFDHLPSRNEFVFRVQPDEAMYMKLHIKAPGMKRHVVQAELDLTYHNRFNIKLPDAYPRLIFDVIAGDRQNFVRSDELREAWKIFTPLLNELEKSKIKPLPYEFGSRGPVAADEKRAKAGYVHDNQSCYSKSWKKQGEKS